MVGLLDPTGHPTPTTPPLSCIGVGRGVGESWQRSGWCLEKHLQYSRPPRPTSQHTHKKKGASARRGEGTFYFVLFFAPTMSVLIATQLKIDTSTPSRRVRGPLLACTARCGGMFVFMSESTAPDRKGCWLVLITTGQAGRRRRKRRQAPGPGVSPLV